MDDPTKKSQGIISGEATVREGEHPTTMMQTVIVAERKITLEGLLEKGGWGVPSELVQQFDNLCGVYLSDKSTREKCMRLMEYVAEKDASKENFPDMAPHLPAIFSLPAHDQEELLTAIGENINQGNFTSAYKCILETHEEVLRARVYSGLERLGLTPSDLDNQYIWNNLTSVFLGYTFLQNISLEDQDEFQERACRLDFLEQIVPHYLDAAKLIPAYLVTEKPEEAKAIARRIAVEYTIFHDEKTLEEIFERVTTYTRQEIEKESKKAQREGELSSSGQEEECFFLEREDGSDALRDELTAKEKEIRSLQELLDVANSSVTDLSRENADLKKTYLGSISEEKHQAALDNLEAARKQATASAEEADALRKQYAEYISPVAHRTALENESRALKAQYDQYISLKEYHAKATEWNAAKRKLEDAVKEARNASAPSGSGRWRLAAALGALGVSLAAGGILYFFEARQNEELTKRVDRLNAGNQECVKANESLYQEGRGFAEKVAFYEKQAVGGNEQPAQYCQKNLRKLTPAQLGALEQELQKFKEAPLTEEERQQQPYQKCASSLSKLSLEELEKLTGDIAKQWEADDYDHLLRQKELPFWLDSLQRVYGVVFTKDKTIDQKK